MKLIDKDAVVAKIKSLMRNTFTNFDEGVNMAATTLLESIDNLEVKEVDSELNSFDATVCKNFNTYLKEMDKDAIIKALEPYKDGDKVKVIIKAQKGE